MNLVIDIGNTYSKIAVFEKDTIVKLSQQKGIDISNLKELKSEYPLIDKAILSTVGNCPNSIKSYLISEFQFFELDESLLLPITNSYHTPKTLGKDRLAGVVAASILFPSQNNLIIDAGTCITLDFIDEHTIYHGGAILPGIDMKFEALHTFTSKLPLLSRENNTPPELIGKDTNTSIQSGVLNGTLFEIKEFITSYANIYKDLNVILTGGDYKYFEKNLIFRKFAIQNLVLIGLNIILHFNVENKNN